MTSAVIWPTSPNPHNQSNGSITTSLGAPSPDSRNIEWEKLEKERAELEELRRDLENRQSRFEEHQRKILQAIEEERTQLDQQWNWVKKAKKALIEEQNQLHKVVGLNAFNYSLSGTMLVIDKHGSRTEKIMDVVDRLHDKGTPRAQRGKHHRADPNGLLSLGSAGFANDSTADIVIGSPQHFTTNVAKNIIDLLNSEYSKDPSFKGLVDSNDSEHYIGAIIALCQELNKIVESEPLYLQLQSPIYVLGDIHGNFNDIHMYMNNIINFGQMKYTANKFLLLGDYVDRGDYSLEVVAYLFAMKYLSPSSVYMLRGNHEVWSTNSCRTLGQGSFKAQCHRRYGIERGDAVWLAVNHTFSLLPLAASIDGKIFCVHGGIPRYRGGKDRRIQMLQDHEFPRFNSLEKQENDPPKRAKFRELAMDLLWSDPAMDDTNLDEFGFGPNTRGPATFTYGNIAIDTFLKNFGFQYIIRAHEVKQEGLRICKNAKVITVFTSSSYCGQHNGSGAVFVANSKIRFITYLMPERPLIGITSPVDKRAGLHNGHHHIRKPTDSPPSPKVERSRSPDIHTTPNKPNKLYPPTTRRS